MRVGNDVAYVRDIDGRVKGNLEVGTKVWVWQYVHRPLGDYQQVIIAEGRWAGYSIVEDYLEIIPPH